MQKPLGYLSSPLSLSLSLPELKIKGFSLYSALENMVKHIG
jgi:hypothetical protein